MNKLYLIDIFDYITRSYPQFGIGINKFFHKRTSNSELYDLITFIRRHKEYKKYITGNGNYIYNFQHDYVYNKDKDVHEEYLLIARSKETLRVAAYRNKLVRFEVWCIKEAYFIINILKRVKDNKMVLVCTKRWNDTFIFGNPTTNIFYLPYSFEQLVR